MRMNLIPVTKKENLSAPQSEATKRMGNLKKRVVLLVRACFLVVVLSVAIYPFLPLFRYHTGLYETVVPEISANAESDAPATVEGNILAIPKIGVKTEIVGGNNAEYAWSKGAWLEPATSTPDKGGNTVFSAHRFRYLPPHEKTFYLLDKLEAGDTFSVYWEGKEYRYIVRDTKVVLPTDVYILEPTDESIITLYTCTPIFSTAKRLVVTGELTDII